MRTEQEIRNAIEIIKENCNYNGEVSKPCGACYAFEWCTNQKSKLPSNWALEGE